MTDPDPALTAQVLADAAYPPLDALASPPVPDAPCAGCSGITDPNCCSNPANLAAAFPPYPEFGYSTGLGSDDDLPGMWEHADFE